MLGLIGLLGALVAGLSLDSQSEDTEGGREAEDWSESEAETWGVSTAFMDADDPIAADSSAEPKPQEPAKETKVDGLPRSDDSQTPPDPDLILTGQETDDDLQGCGGVDTIAGKGGQDYLSGGAGQDEISGGDGNDSLWGDLGDDQLSGDAGDDLLAACEGDDLAQGGDGDDTVLGGTGDDILSGQSGDDLVDGGTGNDQISGGDGSDEVEGGAGDDSLWGGFEASDDEDRDFLNGGLGDDRLHLGSGDYANGGQGSDSFVLQDFTPGAPLVQITDFDPAEDRLVVMYDATLHPSPQLSLGAGGGATILMLDGVPLLSLTNGAQIDLSTVDLQAA